MGLYITTWQAYPCSTGHRMLFTNTHTLWTPFDGKGSNASRIPLFHYGTTVYQFSKAPIDKLPSHNCFQYGWMELIYFSLYCSLFLKENPWSIRGALSLRTYHCTYRDVSKLGQARSFCNDWAIVQWNRLLMDQLLVLAPICKPLLCTLSIKLLRYNT